MSAFVLLCGKLSTLYFLVFAGFLAARIFNTRKESLAPLVIYMITPLVVFSGAVRAKLEFQYLILPVLFMALASAVCLFTFWLARKFFPSPSSNILALTAGTSNCGYFGLPVGLLLFGQDKLSLLVLCILGYNLFESSLGFYITARGHHSPRESLSRVLKLPGLYAFFLGIALNFLGILPGESINDLLLNMRGAYSVLGMMILGMGVADIKHFRPDLLFNLFVTLSKFAIWPLAGLLVLYIDSQTTGLFEPQVRSIIFFMCALPAAANTVAFAAELRAEPERAAIAVLISSLLALILVPLLNSWFAAL